LEFADRWFCECYSSEDSFYTTLLMFLATLLAQMISAKFSHELSGILGAIKNSVDFIDNPNDSIKNQSVRLASSAANSAVIRLRFFRELYGYSDEPLSIANIERLANDFFSEKHIKISFEDLDSLHSSWRTSNHAKLFLCAAVLSQAHLPSGGTIRMDCGIDEVWVRASGDFISFSNDSKRSILTDPRRNSFMSIWNVHEHYARQLADELALRISISEQDEVVSYRIFS
jgi:hypothetical protein